MKILIDLSHPAHVNFFKNSILALIASKQELVLTYLQRGKLPSIINKEFRDIKKYKVGNHRGTIFSIIFQANILKVLSYIPLIIKEKPNVCLSVGSFTQGIVCKLFGIPNIQFDDDPERKLNVLLEKLTSTELYFPPIIQESKKIKHFNALKEWAYLSPDYFNPDKDILAKYGLNEGEYIFIREVSSGSLNYNKQEFGSISSFANQLPNKYKVIFSLEKKSDRKLYPAEWIDLIEPVDDLHSLIYFSKYLISSGDSMAREGGMLGIPSIYCGIREMKANKLMEKSGILFKSNPIEIVSLINRLENHEITFPSRNRLRSKLLNEWENVTDFILKRIKYYESLKK